MPESKRLVWDTDVQKKYETGVDRTVLYPSSGKGVAWSGMSAVNETPSGAEPTPIYADNIKYLELRSAEEFGGSIEAYTYPDEWEECDGSVTIADGVSIGQQTRKSFGLCYRTIVGNQEKMNDYGYKLHLIYNALVSPSEKAYQTVNDSPEATAFSWDFTTTPIPVEGHKPTSSLVIDSTKVKNPAGLKALEDALYGTETTDPYLPTPAQVISLLATQE